jgi:hypothetical protein
MLARLRSALAWLWAHRCAAAMGLASVVVMLAGALVGRRRKPARIPTPRPPEREEGRHEGAAAAFEQMAREAGERADVLEQEAAPRPAEPAAPLDALTDEESAAELTRRGW